MHSRGGLQTAGFTLVELVVALGIAVLLLGAITTSYARLHDSMGYRATLRQLNASLHAARNQAQRQGREAVFGIDLQQRCFGIDGRCDHAIPAELEIELQLAAQDLDHDGRGWLRFYPDGGATGGSIFLARPGSAGVHLRVDWLLGRITQEQWAG